MMRNRLLLIALLVFPLLTFAETFVAGTDYEVIKPGSEKISTDKTSVTEFFSYGCPWCYRIEPSLNQWVKKHASDIHFIRVPVVFNKEWVYYAKAYYTVELLGVDQKLNPLLFKAIQTDKRPLNNNQAMIDFFISAGVDKELAESAFMHSTTIDMRVNEGNALMSSFHVNAVPAIVIDNRYKTDLQLAKNEERLFKIMDYLLTLSKHHS